MQFQNNQPGNQNMGKQKLGIGAIVFVLLLMGVALFIGLHNGKKQAEPQSYYDPGSGQTVSNPAGKTPESYGANPNQPIFLGFDKLLDVGVTTQQLVSIKRDFTNYSIVENKQIKEVSLTVSTINRLGPSRDEEKDVVTFDITLDRTHSFKARVESTDLNTSRLYLSDSGGKQLFDSDSVDNDLD